MPEFTEISARMARKIVKSACPAIEDEIDFERDEYMNEDETIVVRHYKGDTHFDQDFAIEADTVLVSGDLIVNGLLSDCNIAEHTLLVVCGNLKATNLHARGEVIVGGNLDIGELAYLSSSNDYMLHVGGSLFAQAFIEEGTYCVILGNIEAHKILSLQSEIVQGREMQPVVERRAACAYDILQPHLLEDAYPDRRAVLAAQRNHTALLPEQR